MHHIYVDIATKEYADEILVMSNSFDLQIET